MIKIGEPRSMKAPAAMQFTSRAANEYLNISLHTKNTQIFDSVSQGSNCACLPLMNLGHCMLCMIESTHRSCWFPTEKMADFTISLAHKRNQIRTQKPNSQSSYSINVTHNK